MSDTEKSLNKLLVITEKETQRIIQQYVRKSSTFSDECLEKYDLNNISSVKEISRYGFISSKITKNDTFFSGKCIKLANIQVIVWKNAHTKELVIIFVEYDSSIIATNKTAYTVHINLIKNAFKELKPVKYSRVTNRRHISRRNVTRPSAKNIPRRTVKKPPKYDKSSNNKLEQKSQKPRFLKSTTNLEFFLKNTIDKDTNFTSKYVTAIFTPENATKSEDVSKIFLSRHIRYKNDLNNFVNTMEEYCPSMKCDKYEYIRKKIDKNHIPVDNIKSIAFIRKKYVKIFLRKSTKILKKFSNNFVSRSSIKISGDHFINVKSLNMKLETIKLFTLKHHNKCENIEKNIVNKIEIEEIYENHELEKCIQSISQEQTIESSSKVDSSHKPKIIKVEATAKLTKNINENVKSHIKDIQPITSNKQQAKTPRKEEMLIIGKNILKQDPKPVVNKAQVDNKPVIVNKDAILAQIQESIKLVTKRLAKNTQIIREIANKSSQFVVRGSQIPLQSRELLKNSAYRKNKVTEINRETKKSDDTSQSSLKSAMEQHQILQKLKQDRKFVTITPIKNYIVDNRRKVGDNSIRSGSNAQKVKKSSKKSITPVINSKYIVSHNGARKPKEPLKLNDVKPVIQTRGETPLVGKIMRPVPKELPESQNLTSLTMDDLIPFQSEYPRKDHLNSLSKPNSRMETFLNKLCSSNCLEPLIKCSDKHCKSCTKLAETEPAMKGEKTNDMPQKHNEFDFQQYISEPSTSYGSNYNLYPITEIQISPKINPNQTSQIKSPNCNTDSKKSVPISTLYQAKPKQFSGDVSKNRVNNKIAKKTPNFGPSNKIQKAIEQSISKNTGQQKIVKPITKLAEQSRTASAKPSINNRKVIGQNQSKQSTRSLAPKIFTPRRSNTSIRTVQNKVSPICNKRKVNVPKSAQRELLFDQKYKVNKNVCDPLKASKNMLLETLSKTDETSPNDIQKYLTIIEQKFLKTFSLPEEEKVDAYNTLAQEINGMLSILSTENAKDKQLKIIESLERLTNMSGSVAHKSQSYEKISNSKRNFKFSTHSLIDLAPKLRMMEEAISSEEIKKKVADDAQPTVCTESINFMKSLTAIMSKQTQLFPSVSASKNDDLKKPASILKITSSCRMNNSKKVRFGPHDSKHLKSDVSVTFSSSSDDDDEDYLTIFEEDVMNFTSEEDVTSNSPGLSSLVYFKTNISYAFVENLAEISYVILVFHQILIIDQDSLHSINYKTEPDLPFIKTSEFEVKMNDFDVKFSKSNFTFSSSIASTANLNYTFSDISSSNIDIDNVDYIPIEAKGSPNVLEFLNIMANLSFEPVPYREEMFYQTIISYIHTTYETTIYYSINIFHEIEIHCSDNLQALVPKLSEQSKQLSELTGNMNFNLHPRLVSMKPSKLHSQYLEMAYRMQKEKYDTLLNLRQTRSLNMMLPIQNIHNQTLVLNMHVQNYQQSQIDDASINSKCSEDKKVLRKAENNCNVICNENKKIHRSYKSMLIFLYIAIFSTILFCTFLINYKCE